MSTQIYSSFRTIIFFLFFFFFKELFEALKEALKKDQKESCLALNLIICFLFRELKDKQFIRR